MSHSFRRPFPRILVLMVKTFRMLLKRHIVRRAIWLLFHREITLERGLLVTSSFPGRVHFALVFPFASIGLVIARNAIIILSYDNGVISQSGAPKNVESRGAKIHGAKMSARKLTLTAESLGRVIGCCTAYLQRMYEQLI